MSFSRNFLKAKFTITGEEKMNRLVQFVGQAGPNQGNAQQGIKSSTVVFAIKYKGGVVVAGDRRTGGGYDIISDTSVKVFKLTPFSCIACAGYCNVISFIEENMSTVCNVFLGSYGQELSTDGQAHFLKTLLESWWFFFVRNWHWTPGLPILATYDVQLDRPRIIAFDYDGYFYEPPFFAGTGCGFDSIKGLVIDRWKSDISEEEAINLAVRAQIHSGAGSLGVSDSRIVLPTIALIDKSGFRWVGEGIIRGHRDELIKGMEGVTCLIS